MRYADIWPKYARYWNSMIINPNAVKLFTDEANFAITHKATYQLVEKATGLPWVMVAVIHRRESDGNFHSYLGNGQSLLRPTTEVPQHRGPFLKVADQSDNDKVIAAFIAGAIDAVKQEGWGSISDWRLEKQMYYEMLFNGDGYELRGEPSPYIFGLTNIERPGKYVADHDFDPRAMDTQPGCAPLMWMIAKLDNTVVFTREN